MVVASQAPQATVVAYDKLTGELKWQSPALAGLAGYVSPSLVKVGGEDHLVMIMAAKGFKPLASAQLLAPGENWAPIALVDGKLLIRDQKQMKWLQVAQTR